MILPPSTGKSTLISVASVRSLTSTPLTPTFQYSASGMRCTCWTISPASTWIPSATVLLAPSGSTKPIRAPSPWNPRPWLSGAVAASAEAPNEARPAVTMSAPNSDPFRFIAETLSVVRAARVSPRPRTCRRLFRSESSSECSPPQLEHEAEPSVERESVEVDFLADDLPDGGIEEVGLGRARVPDRLAVEPGSVRHVQVEPAEELRAEAVVVIAEIDAGLIGTLHREPFPSHAAAHVGLDLR